jgi:hypothetical protein
VRERTTLPLPVGRLTLPPDPVESYKAVLVLLRGEEPDGRRNYTFLSMLEHNRDAFLATGSHSVSACIRYGGLIEADGEGDPSEELQTRVEARHGSCAVEPDWASRSIF